MFRFNNLTITIDCDFDLMEGKITIDYNYKLKN